MSSSSPQSFPTLPDSSFLFGHLPQMQEDTYGFYLRYHQQYGEYLRFKAIPGIPFYSFASPDALHHILIKSRQKYSRGARWRSIVGYLGGNGLVTSTGEYWQQQRHRMNPYFHTKKLRDYAPIIVNNTLSLGKHWHSLPEESELNISEAMMFLGLINVSDALFGYDIRQDARSFSAAMVDCFATVDRFIVNPFMPPRFLPTRFNRNFKKQLAVADHIATKIIEAARQNNKDTMVKSLINAGNSDRELRDEIITLLMAGHDTTATALAWAWYLLARHPDVLRNVQDELHGILKGTPPTADHMEHLPYTRMVFEETLRLYPSVWSMHRFSEEEDEIGEYPVRKGCSMALPVYVAHRNPSYWQYPNHFYPEHFSNVSSSVRPRFAYLPFGAGEHVCIGGQLAMMEGVLILATLLQHFTPLLKMNIDVTPIVAFTLKPSRDIIGIKKSFSS